MDISPSALYRNWLPNLPSILRTSVLAVLGRTENTEHQDALTQIIVAAARPILQTPAALKKAQNFFCTDWPVIGRTWVAKYTIPVRLERREKTNSAALDVREAVKFAITKLNPPYLQSTDGDGRDPCTMPGLVPVETEWTAHRPHAWPISLLPRDTQANLYERMMKDVPSDGPTILYLHGGAHCLMDPATHRFTTCNLAREAEGSVLSVRYRLSPQHIFPSALMDAFVTYLALLVPPEGAFHEPVPAERIVLAGDSSGGGIAAALMLLLLTLGRDGICVRWCGSEVRIPERSCAGLAVASPWLDLGRSCPSCVENGRWDVIALPPHLMAETEGRGGAGKVSPTPAFPEDELWPTSPPRAETYCEAKMAGHPLVSPLAAKGELWKDCPDVWVTVGWEGMQDESEVWGRRVWEGGTRVVFEGFEGMPHCFAVVPWGWAGWEGLRRWGRFCGDVARRGQDGDKGRRSVATWTSSKTGQVREVRLEDLGKTQMGSGYERRVKLDNDEVDRRIDDGVRWRIELEEELVRQWRSGEKVNQLS